MLGFFAIENRWFSDTYWICETVGKMGGILRMTNLFNSKEKTQQSTSRATYLELLIFIVIVHFILPCRCQCLAHLEFPLIESPFLYLSRTVLFIPRDCVLSAPLMHGPAPGDIPSAIKTMWSFMTECILAANYE